MAHTIANDKRNHLSLSKVVSAAKAKEQIFSNLADTLVYSDQQNNQLSLFNILSIVSLVVSLITGIFTTRLMRKTYILAIAMQLMSNSQTVSTASIPNFNYFELTTSDNNVYNPQNECTELYSMLHMYNFILGVAIVLIGLIIFVVKYFKATSCKTHFILEITNGLKCIQVKIVSVTNCPYLWELSKQVQPDIQVVGSLAPTLKIDWDDAKLVNLKQTVDLPYKVRVGFFQGLTLKKIINESNFYAFPYFQHHNMATEPRITGNLVGKSTANLYPSLNA